MTETTDMIIGNVSYRSEAELWWKVGLVLRMLVNTAGSPLWVPSE